MTTNIEIRRENLPATVEELARGVIVGKEALKAAKARLRAISKIDTAATIIKIVLGETQDMAEHLLDAECRLGEMLDADNRRSSTVRTSDGQRLAGKKPLPDDINRKQSHEAQQLFRHPETVERCKAEAREAGEIVTSRQVLRQLKEKRISQCLPVVIHEDVCCTMEELVATGHKFRTIYADPPWNYGNQRTRAATGNHYQGMTVEQICAMPVLDLIEGVAHLHLWTTNAFLFEAERVMQAWGFEYKSILLWIKPQMGIGNYWRVCHEFLLFGLRGDLPMAEAHRNIRSWQQLDRIGHSTKPEEFRRLIEQVSYPARLELFARKAVPGWSVFGNQIEGYEMFGKGKSANVVAV